jgi:hypothetical protein
MSDQEPTFAVRGKSYVRTLVEPLLSGSIYGEVTAFFAEGRLDFYVSLERIDHKRLATSCCLALDGLLRALAGLYPEELPEGLGLDKIGVNLVVADVVSGRVRLGSAVSPVAVG